MSQIRAVAVFCGSQPGRLPAYLEAAHALGAGLAAAGIRLIYGGGRIGMMGGVADAVLAGGGAVTGVIPDFLTRREVAHTGASEMIVTDSMHTRKRRMFDLVDAFVTMPGGLGTLDETFEIITWRQLGLHDKPILLCDIAGSARPMLAAMEAAIAEGFARPDIRDLFEVVEGVPALLVRLATLSAAPGGASARL
jgi:uncharacterized protein (TIGR00730 family)